MQNIDSPDPCADYGSGDPLVDAARSQVAAARLRRGSLIASGKLSGPDDGAEIVSSKTLPNYRLLRELHRGGQGVVYLALQESTGREVAVKIFRPGTLENSAERGRFEREVDALTRLRHPNIVTIHDCGRAGDSVYLVMDYVAGRPLDAYIAERRLDIRASLSLFAKICDAVHAAHLRGVIHRDLKPSNIRVDEEGEPRILDFGLAKWTEDATSSSSAAAMTITGQFVGSLPWASPEQATGSQEALDLRTDVYSLGVLFYQLLTGEFPYPVGGRMDEVVRHIATTDAASPSEIERAIGHEVETILLKALSKEPERRYQSAGELARDIRRYLGGEPIEAKRDSVTYYLGKQLRRHKRAVAGVLLFMIVLAAGLTVSATQWYRAEQALAREEAQRKSADQRARETQQVADFQAKMLNGVDIDAMAQDIKSRFREQVRLALQRQQTIGAVGRASVTEEFQPVETEARMAAFDRLAGAAQAVDLARSVMADHLLKPAARSLRSEFGGQPLVAAQIGTAIGKGYHALSLFAEAEPYLREALETNRRLLGNDDLRTIECAGSLGLVLQAKGNFPEAESLLREALEARRRLLGDNHPHTLLSQNNVGVLLYLKGEPGASTAMHRKTLDARRRILGPEHPETLGSMLNLTYSLRAAGRLTEAETFGRETLTLARRILGPKDASLTNALANLGGVLMDLGNFTEAEPLLRENLALRRQILGDAHPEVAGSMSNLGELLHEMGNDAQAEPMLREALALRIQIFGKRHFMVAQSLSNLGDFLKDRQEYAEAEEYLREALALFRDLVGADHPAYGQTLKRLGWLLHLAGKEVEAESMLREAIAVRQKAYGDHHPYVGLSMHDLGWALADQGRCAEAEPLLREALSMIEKRYPIGHSNVEKSRMKLAECLLSHAAFAEAETLLAKSDNAQTASDAPFDLREFLMETYAKLYEKWDEAEPGKGHSGRAATWRDKLAELRLACSTAQ